MLARILFVVLMFVASVCLRAPASVWDSFLRSATQGQFSLLETEGSVWRGAAQLGLLDPAAGVMRPVMPLAWQWHPGALFRGNVAWDFSLAGSTPFTLEAKAAGFQVKTLVLRLPARFAMERIPNAIGRAGWHGDLLINAPGWRCTWRMVCDGNLSARWQGAASDLFPNRHLGDYRADFVAEAGKIDMNLATETGDVRVNAHGALQVNGAFQASGTITGDPAFVNRIPNVASGVVKRTGQSGVLSFDVNLPGH